MYLVDTDEQVQQQIVALPAEALPFCAELRSLLEVNPWGGDPVNDQHPDGPVRTLTFGREHEGLAAYLILDDLRRVDLRHVTWLGQTRPGRLHSCLPRDVRQPRRTDPQEVRT